MWFDREISYHSQLFKEAWRIKARQRLKMFMWVVARHTLLTNHARVRRGLLSQDTCILYGHSSETTLHFLRDCTYTRIDHSFITNSFIEQSLLEWLERDILNETQLFYKTIGLYFFPWLVSCYAIAGI